MTSLTQYVFNFGQNQRVMTFNRYSVIDVVETAPVFLYSVLKLLGFLSVGYASVTFKINTIDQMFSVKKRNQKSKNGPSYWKELTTCQ